MLTMDASRQTSTAGDMPAGNDFYKNLRGFSQFSELTQPAHYLPAPPDWYVMVTDIKGSTEAIAQGKYKEVNLIGAAVIMAILNIAEDTAIPYAFGGDGATMLIPPALRDKALETLASVQAKVLSAFTLELRGGLVPVDALYAQGASLLVAKFHLSTQASQAVFQGNALSLAESWLKKGGGTVLHGRRITDKDPDLQGLECRWQPIENRHGKMLSLLVKVTAPYAANAWQIYDEVIHDIDSIYPEYAQCRPSYAGGMKLSFAPASLSKEVKLRGGRSLLAQALYFIRIMLLNAIGQFSFATRWRVGSFDGTQYLSEMVANSDARKFDEMLRMVLDSTEEQHKALERTLESRRQSGQITYGIHVSPQALMTCLVFNLSGNHVHLIDGADGGYALAAQQMKQQGAS